MVKIDQQILWSVLDNMTDTELSRTKARIWKNITEHDGYQAFGYDARTLHERFPVDFEAYMSIHYRQTKRLHEQKEVA